MSRFHVGGGPSDKRGSQKFHRRIGSIANRSGRVPKGTKMPGQVGGNYKCIRGLQVSLVYRFTINTGSFV